MKAIFREAETNPTGKVALLTKKVLPSSVPVGKFSATQVELRLALLSL